MQKPLPFIKICVADAIVKEHNSFMASKKLFLSVACI